VWSTAAWTAAPVGGPACQARVGTTNFPGIFAKNNHFTSVFFKNPGKFWCTFTTADKNSVNEQCFSISMMQATFFFWGGGVVSLAISNVGQVQGLIPGPAILLLVKMFISEDNKIFIYNIFLKILEMAILQR
jgi:hypothetical protein